jgi:hypothetical protein
LFIVSVVLALSVSAICSMLEATLLSFTPTQVAELTNRQPRLGALWQRFKSNIERPIAVILLVNTAAHTIGATVAGAQFETVFGDEGVIWFSLVFTYLMLQFTEILPQDARGASQPATRAAHRAAARLSRPRAVPDPRRGPPDQSALRRAASRRDARGRPGDRGARWSGEDLQVHQPAPGARHQGRDPHEPSPRAIVKT